MWGPTAGRHERVIPCFDSLGEWDAAAFGRKRKSSTGGTGWLSVDVENPIRSGSMACDSFVAHPRAAVQRDLSDAPFSSARFEIGDRHIRVARPQPEYRRVVHGAGWLGGRSRTSAETSALLTDPTPTPSRRAMCNSGSPTDP